MLDITEVKELLNTKFALSEVVDLSPDELILSLIQSNLITSEEAFNMFVIESLQKAYENGEDFPIKYYSDNEELDEDSQNNNEFLTDDYIKQNLI